MQDLDKQTIKILEDNPAKLLKNVLADICPNGTSRIVAASLANTLDLSVKTSELSKLGRTQIAKAIKELELNITGLAGMDKAVVADGGVPLEEVDMRTMRSSVVDNLFITGDLLHINRPSGGFSLQLCWTTGHLAGINSANQ